MTKLIVDHIEQNDGMHVQTNLVYNVYKTYILHQEGGANSKNYVSDLVVSF